MLFDEEPCLIYSLEVFLSLFPLSSRWFALVKVGVVDSVFHLVLKAIISLLKLIKFPQWNFLDILNISVVW